MRIKNLRDEIRTAAERWWKSGLHRHATSAYAIKDKLAELDVETATAEDIAELIGHKWVYPWECTECGVRSWDVVEFGEVDDYESQTAFACKPCLQKAIDLASSHGSTATPCPPGSAGPTAG